MELNTTQKQLDYNDYVSSLVDYIYLDLDNEYYKLLEIAIECGMTSEEFWNGDIVMFAIYSNAYINRLHKQAFVNGIYYDRSLQIEIGNVFLKKGQQPYQYPTEDIFNPLKNMSKQLEYKRNKNNKELTNADLYYDTKKAFHIKEILNSKRKGEK